jgi:hypothetical protein
MRSVDELSPIGVFFAIRLQWLFHDAFKALPAKADFTKGFNSSQAKDRWSTTPLVATREACQDLAILCVTLADDPSLPAWCQPISMLTPWTHTSEECSDA